jgi:hypothetical protein
VKVNTRPGRDGKWYPVSRDRAELNKIIGIEHTLHCQEGLSRHKLQKRLLARYGIKRSIGAISQDLARYECSKCAPAPAVRPAVIAWR